MKRWGYYGDEPPCERLTALLAYLRANKLDVYSEHGEEPTGWVNVRCARCGRVYETTLDPHLNISGDFEE